MTWTWALSGHLVHDICGQRRPGKEHRFHDTGQSQNTVRRYRCQNIVHKVPCAHLKTYHPPPRAMRRGLHLGRVLLVWCSESTQLEVKKSFEDEHLEKHQQIL